MAAIADITVFDGATTPVAHVLSAISVAREGQKVTAVYRENLPNVPVYASPRLTLTMERMKSGVYRLESRAVVPVMEAVLNQNASGYTAAPKVAYENTVVVIGMFHERSDSNGRRLVKQLVLNLFGNIAITTAPVTVGVIDELFARLIAPT